MASHKEHRFDTSLVIIYPLSPDGALINPQDAAKQKRFVKVDGERYEIPPNGRVIEKWKADAICTSLANMYTTSTEDLKRRGISPGDEDYRKRIGGITDRPKYAYRVARQNEIVAAVAPVDEALIQRVIATDPAYSIVFEEFGDVIRATMRTRPDLELGAIFEGFANVLNGTAKA